MTLENGAKTFPGLKGKIRMENSSRCFLELNGPGGEMQLGFYECGSLIPRSNNQTENAVFARFKMTESNISKKVMDDNRPKSDMGSPIRLLLERLESTQRRIPRRKSPSLPLIPYLNIIFAGLNMLMTVTILTKRCRRRENRNSDKTDWGTYGDVKRVTSDTYNTMKTKREQEPALEDYTMMPPPMRLLPTRIVSRHTDGGHLTSFRPQPYPGIRRNL